MPARVNPDVPGEPLLLKRTGKRLRVLRRKRGLTMAQLGSDKRGRVYFERQYVWKMETGRVAPSLSALAHFARRLDVTLSELLGGSDRPDDVRHALRARLRSLRRDEHPQMLLLASRREPVELPHPRRTECAPQIVRDLHRFDAVEKSPRSVPLGGRDLGPPRRLHPPFLQQARDADLVRARPAAPRLPWREEQAGALVVERLVQLSIQP